MTCKNPKALFNVGCKTVKNLLFFGGFVIFFFFCTNCLVLKLRKEKLHGKIIQNAINNFWQPQYILTT